MMPFVASVGLAALLGVIVHELIHYIIATLIASNASIGWYGQPEVRYETDSTARVRAINLAPSVIGISLIAYTLVTAGWPSSANEYVTLAFAVGLIGFSKSDWSLSAATVSAD